MEINALRTLDHPNVLKIYGAYHDKNRYYVVTELLKGGELFETILQMDQMREQDVCLIMQQIFSAVSHMHCQNIMHLDLKPENILLEERARGQEYLIKIANFGRAKFFDPDEKNRQGNEGTIYYKAPEVFEGQQTYKCDIWSSGVIMYMLFSGQMPFDGENDDHIRYKVQNVEPDYKKNLCWFNVSREAKDLLKKTMEKRCRIRLTAHKCLLHRWFTFKLQYHNLSDHENILNKEMLANLQKFHHRFKM